MSDSAVIADVSERLSTLTLKERSGIWHVVRRPFRLTAWTPIRGHRRPLYTGATISFDDIRFHDSNRPPARNVSD